VPKDGGLSIPNGEVDERVEEVHVLFIARVFHSNPSNNLG
jgi:hypothetical protein